LCKEIQGILHKLKCAVPYHIVQYHHSKFWQIFRFKKRRAVVTETVSK